MLGTYRPVEMSSEGHPLQTVTQELYAHQLASELPVSVLSEAAIAAYLKKRLGEGASRTAPVHLLARTLHQHTGGNPLFLVSVVNEIREHGGLMHPDGDWEVEAEAVALARRIPDTIRHLVARQRGRLSPEERQTLAAASVAGMEFSAAAVAAALAIDTAVVEQWCEQLAERRYFLRRFGVEEWPDGTLAARYSFLHAVYQHLWHERVAPTQLQRFHQRIGARKERAYGERTRAIAAELAVHFEQGRDYRRAVQYLHLAGENASRLSAHREAISLLTKGLELLKALPDTPERAQQELALQVTRGVPLQAIKSFSSLEVRNAYTRAWELCQEVGETRLLFSVLFGLRTFYHVRGEFRTARELGEQLLGLAQQEQDPACLGYAYRALGATLFHLGEFSAAQAHLEQAMTLCDAQHSPSRSVLTSPLEPEVFGLSYAACILWHLGYPAQALQKSEAACTLVQELLYPFSLSTAQFFAAMCHQLRGERVLTQEGAQAATILAREHGFPQWLGPGTIVQGWTLTEQGQSEAGIAQIRQGLTTHQAVGARVLQSYFLALLAEAYGKTGQAEAGLEVLTEALVLVDNTEERFYEAELYRLKGELLLTQDNKKQRAKGKKQKEKRAPTSHLQHPTGRSVFSQSHRHCPQATSQIPGSACDQTPRTLVAATGQSEQSSPCVISGLP